MRPRTLLALVAIGIVALGGGWYFGVATVPSEQRSVNAGKLMFPDLTAKLSDTAKIEIVHQGKTLLIERHGDSWGLTDRDLYPVQETKLRSMLTALTELRLVEPRTADGKEYAILGVEDPTTSDTGSSDLLRLLDAGGKTIAAVIVGHRRVRTQGNVPDQIYVRRPGAKQSWLAEGNLEVDSDPQLWLDRDIMNLDHAEIARVVSTRGQAQVELDRIGNKLQLEVPAQHPELDAYKLEDVSRALELLTFEDVHKADGAVGSQIGKSTFTTTDGMTVAISVYQPPPGAAVRPDGDKHIFVEFAIAGQGNAAAAAAHLEKKVAGWTYELGAWKETSLLPDMDSLKSPPSAAAAARGAAPAAKQ